MPVSQITNPNASLSCSTSAITNGVLDLDVLKAFERVKSDDGSDILIELIDLYLQGASERISAMRDAADERDWGLLRRNAHTLKGSSSTIGLRQIATTCQDLEEAASSSTGDVNTLMSLLKSRFLEAKPMLIAERNRRLSQSIANH
jgi:HPt (histidine-containing phosphotransfer) domain-containing protein